MEKSMANEKTWVESLVGRVREAFRDGHGDVIDVSACHKLEYACEVENYRREGSPQLRRRKYVTDLLIKEVADNGDWTPRIVIECKFKQITTHDALAYSTKAATHKHVHPYLRYGVLIGQSGHSGIPPRLIRHGAYFDFMAAWIACEPTTNEWKSFSSLLNMELQASRDLQKLLLTGRSCDRQRYRLLRRSLELEQHH